MHDYSAGRTKSRLLLLAALALASVCHPALAQLSPSTTRLLEAQSALGVYGSWTLLKGSNVNGNSYCSISAASQSMGGTIIYRGFLTEPSIVEWIVSPPHLLATSIETLNIRAEVAQTAPFDTIFVVRRAGKSTEEREKYWSLVSELAFDDLEKTSTSGGVGQYIKLYYPEGGVPNAPAMVLPMDGFPVALQEMSKCLGRPSRNIVFNSRWAKVVRVAKQLCGLDARTLERSKPVAIVEDDEADLAMRYCRGVSK